MEMMTFKRQIVYNMGFADDRIERACGFLLFNKSKEFVYCCIGCQSEYSSGDELKEHILFEHQDEENDNDGNLYGCVNECDLTSRKAAPVHVQSEDQKVKKSTKPKLVLQEPSVDIGEQSTTGQLRLHETASINESNEELGTVKSKCQDLQNQPPAKKMKQNKKSASTKIYYCDMCLGITFRTLTAVKQHMKRHVENKIRSACPICRKTPLNFQNHMKSHSDDKPYKCNVCDAAFKLKKNQQIHLRTHTGEQPYGCITCGKSFRSLDARNKHNMRTHTKQLPHPCGKCEKSFMSPSELQQHTFSSHQNVRHYTCDICYNDYFTKKYLHKHKMTHGEKVHACKYCDKKFKTTETKRCHERSIHENV